MIATENQIDPEPGKVFRNLLERLLNDPEVPLQAARVWELLAEISGPSDIQGGPVDARPPSAA